MAVRVTTPSFRKAIDIKAVEGFKFTPPPECPVFEPTEEEFKDPLK